MSSAYELQRAAQQARNREILQSFGLTRQVAPAVPSASAPAPTTPKKRKTTAQSPFSTPVRGEGSEAGTPGSAGSRSSARIKTRIAREELGEDFEDDVELVGGLLEDYDDDLELGEDGAGRKRKLSSGRLSGPRANPKIFGHQPGVPVGTTWDFRMGASQAGIHAPVVAGISGNAEKGAWSIALSGGYEDDIDAGYSLTFTGSGGRDLKGTKAAPKNLRTAPQTSDQEFTKVNAALQRSVQTKKPVRVIRGFKGKSSFAPAEGYRYDGLYTITKAWLDVGESGFKVCRFALVRMDGQPPIPIQAGREDEAAKIIAEFGKSSQADAPPASPTKFGSPIKVDASVDASPSKRGSSLRSSPLKR